MRIAHSETGLDLGVGVGRHAAHLAALGADVTAVDASPAQHRRALAGRPTPPACIRCAPTQSPDRSARSVTPTEVGRAVLPYARAALAAAESVRQTVDAYTGRLRGRVTLGPVSGASGHAFDIAALLADFHDAHPSVEVALTEDTTERMQAALLAGELDIAVLGTAQEAPPPGTAFQMVIDVPLVAAVAPSDPVLDRVDRTSVPLADLRDRPLICLPTPHRGARGARTRLCTGRIPAPGRLRGGSPTRALAACRAGPRHPPCYLPVRRTPSTDSFAPCGSSGRRCVPA
ncbi:LysR substrate-binding domain-containing protein [Streptomyces sp. NPDC085529]|uniref:LysR substrate-binding domain-containing protein n=1 Tax=Streptomyces sp. NPDC085529 TaxID=3365729 RepID=UPI0037D8E601